MTAVGIRSHPLADRVVLVSGACGGMGGAMVRALRAAGARVSCCDLSEDALADLAGSLDDADREPTITVAADLGEKQGAESWVAATLARWDRVDALVNVAGAWRIRPFGETSGDELDWMIRANLKTAFFTAQAVADHMVSSGAGSIVNFASTAGEYGSISPAAHYAAAKGAVIALTKSLARELSPHGVRVNAISPGPIDTDALAGGRPVDREAVAGRTLVGRLGTPDDIAAAAVYLVSDASSFVTGHVLGVNGGSLL